MSRFRHHHSSDLIGAHVSTRGGVCNIFERGREIDAGALAFFSKNANQWKTKDLATEECSRFATEWRGAGGLPVMIHAAYLINLAAINPEFHEKSIAAMKVELQRAATLGVGLVVLHAGAHMGTGIDAGLDRIARSLDRIHRELPGCGVVTLLETSPGQGTSLGCTFEELARVIRSVDEPERVGVCFDTCHVFAAGYDIRTGDGYQRCIEELDREVGIDNVGAFHLNDSKKGLGSRVDRHQHIGEGQIGLDAFAFLLHDERFEGIPKVLETPKTDKEKSDIRNLGVLRNLVRPRRRRRAS